MKRKTKPPAAATRTPPIQTNSIGIPTAFHLSLCSVLLKAKLSSPVLGPISAVEFASLQVHIQAHSTTSEAENLPSRAGPLPWCHIGHLKFILNRYYYLPMQAGKQGKHVLTSYNWAVSCRNCCRFQTAERENQSFLEGSL